MKDALGAVQSVLVLGGASDIALATCRQYAGRGAKRIVLAVRKPEACEGAAADLRGIEEHTAPDLETAVANMRHLSDNLSKTSDLLEHFVAENEPGFSRFTHQSLPEFEQLLRESRQAARDFRDLSRSLKQNPSQLIYEPNYHGVEVAK